MGTTGYHLAQLNIARMRFDIDDPRMQDFVDNLDPVNAAGEESPGYLWRLQTDKGNATDLRVYDDDSWLVNLTVWESLDELLRFVRSSDHLAIMRRRREWFDKTPDATLVLWWIPAGTTPSVAEAQARLDALREHGPTAQAFNFATRYPAPNATSR